MRLPPSLDLRSEQRDGVPRAGGTRSVEVSQEHAESINRVRWGGPGRVGHGWAWSLCLRFLVHELSRFRLLALLALPRFALKIR